MSNSLAVTNTVFDSSSFIHSLSELPTAILGEISSFGSGINKICAAKASKILHRAYFHGDSTLHFSYRPIDDDALIKILEKHKGQGIHSINLRDCPNITKKSIAMIATKYPHLKLLNLTDCCQLDDDALEPLSGLRDLEFLVLINCDKITGEGLKHLKLLTELRELNLSECLNLKNADLDSLAPLKELTSLHLEGCTWLDRTGIAHLSQLSNLDALYLHNCEQLNDEDLKPLAALLNLTTLDLSWCKDIEGTFLPELIHLQTLTLDRCAAFNGENLRLPNLTSLSLIDCPIKTEHFEILNAQSAGLRFLNLSYCEIADEGLKFIGNLKNLRSLYLDLCDEISSVGIGFLSQLSQLTDLSVAGCAKIDDACLETIKLLSNLISLGLSSCRGFSIKGLLSLKELKNLIRLDIRLCGQITRPEIGTLCSSLSYHRGHVYQQLMQDMPFQGSEVGWSSNIHWIIAEYFTKGMNVEVQNEYEYEIAEDPIYTGEI